MEVQNMQLYYGKTFLSLSGKVMRMYVCVCVCVEGGGGGRVDTVTDQTWHSRMKWTQGSDDNNMYLG